MGCCDEPTAPAGRRSISLSDMDQLRDSTESSFKQGSGRKNHAGRGNDNSTSEGGAKCDRVNQSEKCQGQIYGFEPDPDVSLGTKALAIAVLGVYETSQ
jgi:hypothetical protein